VANRSDNFNRTGNVALGGATPSDGGSAWTDVGSDYATATDGGTGEVVAYEATSNSNLAYLDAGVTDVQVDLEVIRNDQSASAAVRVQDANNYYFFRALNAGTTELWKLVGGTYTQLSTGSMTFTPGVGSTISLKVEGSTLTGYVNGVQSTQVTDSDLSSGNNHGFRTSGSFQFMNSIAITDLSGGGGSFIDNTTPILMCILGGG
jgi:pectate lyase